MRLTKTKKQRVLEILLDYKLHHASEFIPITHRFNATMDDLRDDDGYNIKTLPLDGGNKPAWYQLIP